jgi:hypothetical protein
MTDDLKDAVREAYDRAFEMWNLAEEIHDWIDNIDDDDMDKDIVTDADAARQAAFSLSLALRRWQLRLVPNESAPASEPAPASP